ncbi:ammonium transporter AmtB-like domain-containing protein [Chytridium lagenaria]|nr:ammonium transporter AmtB-like domain-containing protein [Chytridium lagenaria]
MAGFVFIMTPGVGFFYSGMTRAKNALTMIMLCMLAGCVVSLQWVAYGFSISFFEYSTDATDAELGTTNTGGSNFIGNLKYAGLSNIGSTALIKTAPAVSSINFALYQMQFAMVTAALIFGSVAERIRVVPAMIFILLWTTFVYDFAAYWTWAWRGWLRNLDCVGASTGDAPCLFGSIDFAGGGPVHVASGFAGLAFCLVLGKRRRVGQEEFKPHNLVNVFLGTALLWYGWYGFNGGSALAGTSRAGMAALVTHVAAAAGGISWPMFDYFFSGKVSGLGFCSGVVSALVAVTPASGFVAPWAGIVIGFTAGIVCNLACRVKGLFGFDDSLDAWGVHGVGVVADLDGGIIQGGAIDGNWKQIGYQFAGSFAIAGYSFVFTYLVLTDDEILGGDLGEMGEVAYELVSTISEQFPEMKGDKTGENTIVV